jgi:hypothetical protein
MYIYIEREIKIKRAREKRESEEIHMSR